MKNVFRIIKKNIKVLLRSKSSALIIIFAPLLVVMLVGVAFDNSNSFGISIGVHAPAANANTQNFVDALSDKAFQVLEYSDQDSCVNDIKTGVINTCVVFPEGFAFDTNEPQEVDFYVDNTKINLVYMIMDTLEEKFSTQSQRISKDLTGQILSQLSSARATLSIEHDALGQVLTEQQAAKTSLGIVADNLQKVDVIYPATIDIDRSVLTLDIAKNGLLSSLKSTKSNISKGRQLAEVSGASITEYDDIKKYINRGITSADNAEDVVTDGNESLAALSGQLGIMQTELSGLEKKLSAASSAIIDGRQKIGSTSQTLAATTETLTSTQKSLAGIINNIDSLPVTDVATIVSPVQTKINPIAAQSTYLNYLFPSLMILVIMFIAILLGTTLVMMEKHSPAYFRNAIAPTRNITFVISTYLTTLLLVVIQLVIIIAIASVFFSAQILPSLPTSAFILLVASTFFALVGMAVGYIFTSEETGTLAAISVGSIFLFMSDVIIPLESMPVVVRNIAGYNPFVIAERSLRSSILFKPTLEALSADIFFLLGGSVILFFLIWGGQHVLSKHPLERVVAFRRRLKKKTPLVTVKTSPTRPHDYLEHMLTKGFSQKKILEAFKDAGYSKRQIHMVVTAFKKKKKKN